MIPKDIKKQKKPDDFKTKLKGCNAGTGPMFGRSLKPIPTGEGRLSPPITTETPNVFYPPALLGWIWKNIH